MVNDGSRAPRIDGQDYCHTIATLISTFQNDCVCVCVRGICVWGGVCVEWIPWLCELIYEKYN